MDIYVRSFHPDVGTSIKNSARMRGMTIAEYLTALYRLHQDLRKVAARGDTDTAKDVWEYLNLHGLGEVRE